jgi:hypothetical protein
MAWALGQREVSQKGDEMTRLTLELSGSVGLSYATQRLCTVSGRLAVYVVAATTLVACH